MLQQTLAIFLDAYRELNAKKLFWVTLGLSGLVVLLFAALGINDRGMMILWFTVELPGLTTAMMSEETFYKLMFVNLGIGVWLAWIATILALISTAGMFPDFVADGAIELVMSKPIGRLRLFLTKYAAGLLFVLLQVAIFTVASMIVIGLRGGAWEPGILLAIPVVTVFFSYLFCVCVLIGVLTRSTIAALLVTLLVWFIAWGLQTTETGLLFARTNAEVSVEHTEEMLARTDERLAALRVDRSAALAILEEHGVDGTERPADDLTGEGSAANGENGGSNAEDDDADNGELPADAREARRDLERIDKRIDRGERVRLRIVDAVEDAEGSVRTWTRWHQPFYIIKTALPKTAETIALLERWLVEMADLPTGPAEASSGTEDWEQLLKDEENAAPTRPDDTRVSLALQEKLRGRSVWWVLGTSLAFEAVILAIAAFFFCRRDF